MYVNAGSMVAHHADDGHTIEIILTDEWGDYANLISLKIKTDQRKKSYEEKKLKFELLGYGGVVLCLGTSHFILIHREIDIQTVGLPVVSTVWSYSTYPVLL